MICYQITINGKKAFTAGANDEDALEARIEKLPGEESLVLSVTAFSPAASYENSTDWGLH